MLSVPVLGPLEVLTGPRRPSGVHSVSAWDRLRSSRSLVDMSGGGGFERRRCGRSSVMSPWGVPGGGRGRGGILPGLC